jgi:hypothetical protein
LLSGKNIDIEQWLSGSLSHLQRLLQVAGWADDAHRAALAPWVRSGKKCGNLTLW